MLNPSWPRVKSSRLLLLSERGVARRYSLSDVIFDRDAPNVNSNVAGEIPRHPDPVLSNAREVARNTGDDEFKSSDLSSDSVMNIGSHLEQLNAG